MDIWFGNQFSWLYVVLLADYAQRKMKTNMAGILNMAQCHVMCSSVFESRVLISGSYFGSAFNCSDLKRLHISIVFLSLFASQVDPGVIVRIDRLAKVDGVLQLLTEHPLTRVPRHLQKEEASVGLGQVVVWGRVFVQHLKWKARNNKAMLESWNSLLLCRDF